MNLRPFIDDVARQADDFLAESCTPAAARTALNQFIALEYPRLVAADRKLIATHVLALLDDEDFFAERFVDSFDPDEADEDEES